MKTVRTTMIALLIAFGSSAMLTGCFVDDEEVFGQLETNNGDASTDKTNEAQWD